MPDLEGALTRLARWLDNQGVPYMVIGGFAVTIWGEPRFTRDLDVTVSVPAERLKTIVEHLSSDFTALVSDASAFVSETRVLPIIVESVPVDVVFAALPYEEDAITRSRKIMVAHTPVHICSPEDLILHKIVSSRPRDREDIEGVFRYRHSELDYAYLDPRVEELADALDDRNSLEEYRALRSRFKSET